MKTYIARRLLLFAPTVFGILLANFAIIQFAPGGPVERIVARYAFGSNGRLFRDNADGTSAGANPPRPELARELEARFGFDKPLHVRFFKMMRDYLRFDFGKSYYRNESVMRIMLEKFPVSFTLAFWSTTLMYLIAIPLGIRKAVKDGTKFDVWSSVGMNVFCAMPSFILAVLLIVLFAGGSCFNVFPIRGLVSTNWHELGLWGKATDYLWHIALPVVCLTLSGFAVLTMLTKNSFVDELGKLYVVAARAKGLSETAILSRHVFRNAMLVVISNFPMTFIATMFSGSMLIEMIFSLDGLGLLGIQSVLDRDYPVVFATLYIYSLVGLVFKLGSDIMLTVIDPRINFSAANA